MPIPDHLKEIAYDEGKKGSFTTFKVKCTCGSVLFDVLESYPDKDERKESKPFYDALDKLFSTKFGSYTSVDADGTVHDWVLYSSDPDGPKEEVLVPDRPIFTRIHAVKAKCRECQREYTLFDSRYDGYDGKYGMEASAEEKAYVPHFRQKKRRDGEPVELRIHVEHDDSLEEFRENTGIDCSFEDYADAYTWITIYSIDKDGKKRKLFDFETA